jgi:hypothetical protein
MYGERLGKVDDEKIPIVSQLRDLYELGGKPHLFF